MIHYLTDYVPKVLVACEQSQVVCKAFRENGLNAYSNDLNPCYGGCPEWHIIGDARRVIQGDGRFLLETGDNLLVFGRWDLIIAHPPCTMLTHSSAVALAQGKHTLEDVKEGTVFFLQMLNAPANMVCVENPAPMKIAQLPPYSQIVNPFNFGHPYSKRACLWLRNLPPLQPTRGYYTEHRQWVKHCAGNSRRRAKTFEGIAEAMAIQWGALLKPEPG